MVESWYSPGRSQQLIAEAGSMTSDLAKGANAVASVFEVLDRKSPQNLQVHIHH
jgi:hypothetical protein